MTTIPVPPDGYETLTDGITDIIHAGLRGAGERTLLVYAEGGWRPITGLFGKINRRSVDVSYTVDDTPRGRRKQRVVPERIARPEVHRGSD